MVEWWDNSSAMISAWHRWTNNFLNKVPLALIGWDKWFTFTCCLGGSIQTVEYPSQEGVDVIFGVRVKYSRSRANSLDKGVESFN